MLSKADKDKELKRTMDKHTIDGKVVCPQCKNPDIDVVNKLFLFHCPICRTGWGASVGRGISKKDLKIEKERLKL